jgi:hypothetical protein
MGKDSGGDDLPWLVHSVDVLTLEQGHLQGHLLDHRLLGGDVHTSGEEERDTQEGRDRARFIFVQVVNIVEEGSSKETEEDSHDYKLDLELSVSHDKLEVSLVKVLELSHAVDVSVTFNNRVSGVEAIISLELLLDFLVDRILELHDVEVFQVIKSQTLGTALWTLGHSK